MRRMSTKSYNFATAREKFSKCVQSSLKSEKKEDISQFVETYNGSDSEKRITLDQAFKDVLKEIVSSKNTAEENCVLFKTLINNCAFAVTQDLCSSFTPFHLLSDLFDTVTLEVCEATFDLVEDNVNLWKSDTFFESGKNYLLRMCNDLLRRLSKAHNTVFCGRIQLFLARLFPLSEKSALNLTSQFNLENVTVYLSQPDDSVLKSLDRNESMEGIEDGEMADTSGSACPIDYNLYRKFWSLQDFFRKPTQCYDKVAWKMLSMHSDEVLKAFDSHKLDDMKSARKKLANLREKEGPTYFAKYLTSEKLFDLQLSDSNFRRYVLVQFLILFQYLNSPVKFRNSSFVLSEEQSQWIEQTQEKVYRLIEETPPEGLVFAQAIKHILKREENWNVWKNEGCPSFEKSKTDNPPVKPKLKRTVGDDLLATGGKIIKMGNAELTRLWNLNPDNLAACRSEKRVFLPTVEDFFAEPIEQADPENMIEEQYKLVNNKNFQWRALRLLARRSPHFFTHTNQPAMALPAYLELMVTKLAREMPQPTEEVKTELEDEEEIKDSQMDADQIKNEDASPTEEAEKLSAEQIQEVCDKVEGDWKKLATELNFPDDDICYFESENEDVTQQAKKMITVWQETEGDRATPGALKIALREIGLAEVADTVFKNITE